MAPLLNPESELPPLKLAVGTSFGVSEVFCSWFPAADEDAAPPTFPNTFPVVLVALFCLPKMPPPPPPPPPPLVLEPPNEFPPALDPPNQFPPAPGPVLELPPSKFPPAPIPAPAPVLELPNAFPPTPSKNKAHKYLECTKNTCLRVFLKKKVFLFTAADAASWLSSAIQYVSGVVDHITGAGSETTHASRDKTIV